MQAPEERHGSSLDVLINEGDFSSVPVALVERAVRFAAAERPGGGEISVTFLSDVEIQALNRDYLAKDCITDVIAFDLGGDGPLLGDVYIGFEQAERQSRELRLSLAEELMRLAVHGTLHVLGYDHPDGTDRVASPMFVLQERLLEELLASEG